MRMRAHTHTHTHTHTHVPCLPITTLIEFLVKRNLNSIILSIHYYYWLFPRCRALGEMVDICIPLLISFWDGEYDVHFAEEKTESQRGYVDCPHSPIKNWSTQRFKGRFIHPTKWHQPAVSLVVRSLHRPTVTRKGFSWASAVQPLPQLTCRLSVSLPRCPEGQSPGDQHSGVVLEAGPQCVTVQTFWGSSKIIKNFKTVYPDH